MRRLVAGVVLLAAALPAQVPAPPSALERRLKDAVDRALDRFVRDLRAELHGAIEEALREDRPGRVGAVEDVLRVPPRASAEVPDLDDAMLARVHRIRLRLRDLRARLGPGAPQVEAIVGDLRSHVGPLADRPVVPWARLGVEVVPASTDFRVLWGLPARAGFVVVRAGAEGALRPGDVLVGYGGRPLGVGTSGSARLARDLSRPGTARARIDCVAASTRSLRTVVVPVSGSVPASPDDPKALMEEMLRRAIREVVPPGGVIVPAGEGKKTNRERRRP